jgi:hypothetical protein
MQPKRRRLPALGTAVTALDKSVEQLHPKRQPAPTTSSTEQIVHSRHSVSAKKSRISI